MSKVSRRQVLAAGAGLAFTSALPAPTSWAANANEEINLGFISCGGRAGQLMGQFSNVPGVNIAGLCDSDWPRNDSPKRKVGPTCEN